MRKFIVFILISFLFTWVLFGIQILWHQPTSSNKYDLDYVLKDFPENELEHVGDDIRIQGILFPKDSYRILYKDDVKHLVTIQFINPDSSDADYVFPLKKTDLQILELDKLGNLVRMKYKDRDYNSLNARVIVQTKDYVLLQTLQPPPGFHLRYDFRLSFGEIISVLQILTIMIAAVLYFRESNREKTIAKREIYQKLELASIDLFKYEGQNSGDLWRLYSDNSEKKFPEKGSHEYWAIQEYVCQVINLFEMIVEFKKQNIIDTQVFLSWVQWFWDISNALNFKKVWIDIKMNYTVPLRNAMDTAVRFAENEKFYVEKRDEPVCEISQQGKYEDFIQEIGRQFNCVIDVKIFLKKKVTFREKILVHFMR
jgi:hypothetical protein